MSFFFLWVKALLISILQHYMYRNCLTSKNIYESTGFFSQQVSWDNCLWSVDIEIEATLKLFLLDRFELQRKLVSDVRNFKTLLKRYCLYWPNKVHFCFVMFSQCINDCFYRWSLLWIEHIRYSKRTPDIETVMTFLGDMIWERPGCWRAGQRSHSELKVNRSIICFLISE